MVQKMSGSGTPTRIVKALEDRSKSIKRWMAGDTAKQKPERQDEQFTIKFDKGTVFLSAVASADIDEVIKLLDKGVDIDTTNNDGLTALHQACIDENDEMVELLLERGANIEAVDNEGWTPLHAAASAGNVDIARILVENDANLAAVNNEGEVPLDLADEDEMDEYLSDEIDNQELEVEEARNEEERVMIEDATSWLNQKKIDEVLDWQEAGALHVAAAKGYNKVISTILQIGDIEVNVRDADGWTPLHAAVHWGSQTATELLTEAGADFDLKNNNGQTACDLAEADFLKVAENCRKRSKELGKKSSSKRGENGTDVNDNSLYAKEINAIEMLKKQPKRPIVKGSRVIYQNKLNNPQAANEEEEKNGEDKEDESAEESESEEETAPSPPPPTTKTTKTSTASISSINKANDVDTSINKTIIKSRSNEREEKKDTSTPIVVKTTVGVGISSRFPKREPEPDPAVTKPIGSRYGVGSTRSDRITSSFDKRSSSTSNTEENNTPSSTRVPFRTTPSRLRDEKDNDSDTNSSSITNRYRPKKTPDDNNSWRTPRKKEDEDTQETEPPRRTRNDDTSTTSTTSSIESRRARPSTDDDGGTRMSIAERLRKKNQELLATTNDNNNSSSSASSTGAGGRSWQRSNLTSNSTSSTSSDTGDTKDLQRKLDQAVKEVEEYKSKYEKLKKEKEELEKQLSQYKEDIDKVQELKSDNIRLKDENGALIRVISKLSRTPASSSS